MSGGIGFPGSVVCLRGFLHSCSPLLPILLCSCLGGRLSPLTPILSGHCVFRLVLCGLVICSLVRGVWVLSRLARGSLGCAWAFGGFSGGLVVVCICGVFRWCLGWRGVCGGICGRCLVIEYSSVAV